MKAIVCTRFGFPNAVQLTDIEKPVPQNDEVLVEVHASCVNYNNQLLVNNAFLPLRILFGKQLITRNRVPGTNLAGRVEAVGKNVKRFKPGDEVYGELFGSGYGCFAEYACAAEKYLTIKPANLSFAEAAAMPEVGLVAISGLRDYAHIKKGQQVLIYSASGGIGTTAIQLAKYYETEVTAVCSGRNFDLVKSLGADYVIDYTKEDFTKNSKLYDVIFAVRKSRSVWAIRRALKPKGIYVSTAGPSPARLFQEFIVGPRIFKGSGKTIAVINHIDWQDLDVLRELIEAGKLKPVIDRTYPLSEITRAFRYYSQGHARGKVVILIK